jgi:DNA polymerase III alpha subunit
VHDIDHTECNRVNAQIEREMKALYKEGETRSAITIKLDDIYRLSPSFREFIAKYPQIEPAVKSLYGREHHVTRHASGVVIGDDLPSETSVFTVTKEGKIVQASFTDGIVNKAASNMGLVKFDILGLATLKVIASAVGSWPPGWAVPTRTSYARSTPRSSTSMTSRSCGRSSGRVT